MAAFAEYLEARCWVENEDVVGAAPTGDAPTTSDWSTILLPSKVRLILEILRYVYSWHVSNQYDYPTYNVSSKSAKMICPGKWEASPVFENNAGKLKSPDHFLLDRGRLSHVCHLFGTVRCHYNAVNFLQNPHKRHPIARPFGRDMACILVI